MACALGVYGGDDKNCFLRDKGVCKSYNITPKNCADYILIQLGGIKVNTDINLIMIQFLVSLTIFAVAQGIAFNLETRCACSTYPYGICDAIGHCSWVNNACVDLQCAQVISSNCNGLVTEYKCAWNSSKNVCESKTYTCSDFATESQCNVNFGFDCLGSTSTQSFCINNFGNACVWSTSTSKCVSIACTEMDAQHCDFFRCSFVNGVCGSPQSVDCSTQGYNCGMTRSGDGTICGLNDSNVCKSYYILPKNCSDYSDYKGLCQSYCIYESSTNTCRAKQCSDYATKQECFYLPNYYYFTSIPCYWSGSQCTEATDAIIQTFDQASCLGIISLNYIWDQTTSKCVQCRKLSNQTQNTINGNQILLAVILSMLLLD